MVGRRARAATRVILDTNMMIKLIDAVCDKALLVHYYKQSEWCFNIEYRE